MNGGVDALPSRSRRYIYLQNSRLVVCQNRLATPSKQNKKTPRKLFGSINIFPQEHGCHSDAGVDSIQRKFEAGNFEAGGYCEKTGQKNWLIFLLHGILLHFLCYLHHLIPIILVSFLYLDISCIISSFHAFDPAKEIENKMCVYVRNSKKNKTNNSNQQTTQKYQFYQFTLIT